MPGDPATCLFNRFHSETAPTAADFQNVICRFNTRLVDDTLQFAALRVFAGVALATVKAAGIQHGRVQKGLEEIVAQVIVFADVPARSDESVGAKRVHEAVFLTHQPCRGHVPVGQRLAIFNQNAKQRRNIICIPESFFI